MTKTLKALAATFILTLVISIPAYLVIKLLGLEINFLTVFAVAAFSSFVTMLRCSWVVLTRDGVVERIEAGRREIRGYETKADEWVNTYGSPSRPNPDAEIGAIDDEKIRRIVRDELTKSFPVIVKAASDRTAANLARPRSI